LPGYGEIMRAVSFPKTPYALLSRAMAGIAGETLIINLPGSPKAVRECLSAVIPAIAHTVEKAQGDEEECGSSAE
jgi:molybdopterin biosynthesis enzyme MoaB